jgi:hypothetical protein
MCQVLATEKGGMRMGTQYGIDVNREFLNAASVSSADIQEIQPPFSIEYGLNKRVLSVLQSVSSSRSDEKAFLYINTLTSCVQAYPSGETVWCTAEDVRRCVDILVAQGLAAWDSKGSPSFCVITPAGSKALSAYREKEVMNQIDRYI